MKGDPISEKFNGFYPETLEFLHGLWENNTKEWFDENRKIYDEFVLEPSKKFVIEMGNRIHEFAPNMIADPKINRSLFRMNRDIRFSKDKTPYKTHVGIYFWEGPRKRMECPGFYFHFEPDRMLLAGGFHQLPKDLLQNFRELVSDERKAEELSNAIKVVEDRGIKVEGLHYKRTPRGFQEDHPYSDLLRYNGVYGMEESKITDELFSSDLVDHLYYKFKIMDPLNRWFLKYIYRDDQ